MPIYSKDERIFCPREKNWQQRKGIPSGVTVSSCFGFLNCWIPFDVGHAKRRIFLCAII